VSVETQKFESNDGLALEEDHYSERLANLNEDNAVVATRDICNAHGATLVKKGARIDRATSERILKHRLFAPLEEQVALENTLEPGRLSEHAAALFDKYPDLRRLHDAAGLQPLWQPLTEQYQLPPVVWQKLTVLQHQMPQEYEKSIFCAWLSVMIGREMHLDDDRLESLYLAGLAHDAGLLHIDPAILNKPDPLNAAQWRAIQCHVVIGKLMIEHIPGHRPEVARAVLEHHERCDGTGYPARRTDRHLQPLGLIIGMADSLQAIRVKQFEPAGRTLIDALPYLRMNAHTYSYPVYQAIDRLLHLSGLQPDCRNPCQDETSFVAGILQRAHSLKTIMEQLDRLHEVLDESASSLRGQDLLRALSRVQNMVLRSGLLKDTLLGWLHSLPAVPEQAVLAELVEVDLMLNELQWQLRNLLHAFDEFFDRECGSEQAACSTVKAGMEMLLAAIS
jgi:HD-GYP domain-containing protein (c-di-GMP phosphodiesterase class II)